MTSLRLLGVALVASSLATGSRAYAQLPDGSPPPVTAPVAADDPAVPPAQDAPGEPALATPADVPAPPSGGAGVPRAAGTAETAGTAVAADAASAPAPAETPQPSGEPLWYAPSPQGDSGRPRAIEAGSGESSPFALGAAYDLQLVAVGRTSGFAHEVRVMATHGAIGGSIGFLLPANRLGLGLEMGRHWGVALGAARDFDLFFMMPSIEPRASFPLTSGEPFFESAILAVGTSGFGVRAVSLPYAVELRLPTLHVMGLPFTDRGSAALATGLSIAAHSAF